MNIINLDELTPEDKVIVLKGKEWVIPSDLPVEYMLRLMKIHQRMEQQGEDEASQLEAFKIAHEVFTIRQPNLKFKEFVKMITLKQFAVLTASLFTEYSSAQEAEEAVNGVNVEAQKKNIKTVN